jgi:hypothetical protein
LVGTGLLWNHHVGKRVGPGHGVFHERGGEELSRAGLIDHLLHERLPYALGHAPVDLALEGDRIDHGAHVVHDHVAVEGHRARVGIDLGLANVAAIGPRGLLGREGARLVEAGLETGGQLRGWNAARATSLMATALSVPVTVNLPSAKTMSASAASRRRAAIFGPWR